MSVIFEVHDEHGEVADYKTIALVMRDSDHYGTEDNPDIKADGRRTTSP